jgi:predicted phosphohydrolase
MTLQYASDLHLEFPENRIFLQKHPIEAKASTLVLAGDIVPFRNLAKHVDFFRALADQFDQVYWLPGNHEYYGADITERSGTVDEVILPNIRLVNNVAVTQANTRLLFSTLWSRIDQLNEGALRRGMADYHAIRRKNGPLLPSHTTRLHEECLRFLQRAFRQSFDGPTVVVTHHVPTFLHYPEQFIGDVLNQGFATELHELIADSNASAWIYGHHHRNMAPYMIGNTQMVTNQLGYVRMGEHDSFSTSAQFTS